MLISSGKTTDKEKVVGQGESWPMSECSVSESIVMTDQYESSSEYQASSLLPFDLA